MRTHQLVRAVAVVMTLHAAHGAAAQFYSLVINEIDYDQPTIDNAEFIEILNVGCGPVNLDPYELRLINGATVPATVYATINLPAVILSPGDYFVVCANTNTTMNCDLDISPETNLIQNGPPDAVALFFVPLPRQDFLVDTVSYEGNTIGAFNYTETAGAAGDDGTEFARGIGRAPNGIDTNNNLIDFQSMDITPGAANVSRLVGPAGCIGDINGNGTVNVDDLLAVINAWGPCANPGNCPADIAPQPCGNDVVNVDDLLAVINAWGPCG